MADATRRHFDQHFTTFGLIEINVFDGQGFIVLIENGGLHTRMLLSAGMSMPGTMT